MEENILKDMYLDLKINGKILGFRRKYNEEYEIILHFNSFFYKILEILSKKGVEQKNMYIIAAVAQLHKLYQSCILLFERGLKDIAYILIRSIIELTFKIKAVLNDEEFIDKMLLNELHETKKFLNYIKEKELFDIVPENQLKDYIELNNRKIAGRKKEEITNKKIADDYKMTKEYLVYKFHCDDIHQSTNAISKLIKKTENGFLIDIDLQLSDFKESIAWLLSISFEVFDVLFNQYLCCEELEKEYEEIITLSKKVFLE